VDKAGDVYVVDFEGGAHTAKAHVEKLAAGSTTPVPFTDLDHPGGVAVDDAGNVYVVDRNHRRVVTLTSG
jgi:serine/threonine-protein kinase